MGAPSGSVLQVGCPTPRCTRMRGIEVCDAAKGFMSREGRAEAGMLVTGGGLIDSLALHRPNNAAVEAHEQQTSYKQLLDLARAIREQVTRSPAGAGPIVIADDPGAGACAAIAAAQALNRAYVPLSASHPAPRIQQILTAVEPALIVQSDRTAIRMADALSGRYPLLTISRGLDKPVMGPVTGAGSQPHLPDWQRHRLCHVHIRDHWPP